MNSGTPTLSIRSSPHLKLPLSTDAIMRAVLFALLPVASVAVYFFGLSALLILCTATLACLGTEALLQRWSGRERSLSDYSAAVTGILFGLTLPPGLPLWMAALGGAVCIGVAKFLAGGLGGNVFNPALVGRAFLLAAFPASLTHWSNPLTVDRFTTVSSSTLALPFFAPHYDAVSGASPLGAFKFSQIATDPVALFFGTVGGSLGETSSLLILAAGGYLALRRMLDWRIPAGILATVFLLSGILHGLFPGRCAPPFFMIFAGGLMLGAVFMATDPVTSPTQPRAVWIFAALVGVLTVVIRVWGGLPEGTMYAILLGNAFSPLLERWTQRRVYGAGLPRTPG